MVRREREKCRKARKEDYDIQEEGETKRYAKRNREMERGSERERERGREAKKEMRE